MLPLVELALATGIRRGELLRLRWDDVDLDRRVAFLADTKNGESRCVPLSTAAVDVLQGLTDSVPTVACSPAARN